MLWVSHLCGRVGDEDADEMSRMCHNLKVALMNFELQATHTGTHTHVQCHTFIYSKLSTRHARQLRMSMNPSAWLDRIS